MAVFTGMLIFFNIFLIVYVQMWWCKAFYLALLERGWNLQEAALLCKFTSVGILQEAFDVEYFWSNDSFACSDLTAFPIPDFFVQKFDTLWDIPLNEKWYYCPANRT